MRLLTVPILLIALLATSGWALTYDNGHPYVWGDPDGDMFDHYAVVRPGDTVRLNIFVNDLDENNWAFAVTGCRTRMLYDPLVIDYTTIYDDTLGVDVDGNGLELVDTNADGIPDAPAPGSPDIANYYAVYWHGLTVETNEPGQWYGTTSWTVTRWTVEDRLVISLNFTIQENAPLGETQIGLEQEFSALIYGEDQVLPDTIGTADPFAMTLNVVPEPATLFLLALGGLAVLRRRKK